MQNSVQGFLINEDEYRGVLVHLTSCYQEMLDLHAYPTQISALLGEMLVVVSLLSRDMKYEGRISCQIETEGAIKFLVAEVNHRHGIRGLAQWRDDVPLSDNLLTEGKFAITLMPQEGERYQGIVPLSQNSIAHSLERYFGHSEQIHTRILLACHGQKAAGLMIQKLPGKTDLTLDKTTLNFLLDSIQKKELLEDTNEHLLYKLFHEHKVRVFEEEAIFFECTCSHEKMESAVRVLGKEEAEALLSTHKNIEVSCDFCNRHYTFDRAEVEKLF